MHDMENWENHILYGDGDIYQRFTEAFRRKNDLGHMDVESQWKVVQEEIEEMEEAYEKYIEDYGSHNPPTQDLAEEMGDVIYTVHLLGNMMGLNLNQIFKEIAVYNLQKSGERNEDGKIVDDVD